MAACSGSGSPFTRSDKSVYIRYVGNPAGVYDAYCFPVNDPPDGHIFEITKLEKVNVIDATYEFLPDGLKVDDPRAVVRYYDCKDFDLHPAPASTTSTVPATDPLDRAGVDRAGVDRGRLSPHAGRPQAGRQQRDGHAAGHEQPPHLAEAVERGRRGERRS